MSIKAPRSNLEQARARRSQESLQNHSRTAATITRIMDGGRSAALKVLLVCVVGVAAASTLGCKGEKPEGDREGRPVESSEYQKTPDAAPQVKPTPMQPVAVKTPVIPRPPDPPKESAPYHPPVAAIPQAKPVALPVQAPPVAPSIAPLPSAPVKVEVKIKEPSQEGLTIKYVGGKYYYMNEDGNNEFGNKSFDTAYPFNGGIALVRDVETSHHPSYFYYINRNGVNAFGDKRFYRAQQLTEGIAAVQEYLDDGVKAYYINRKGENAFGNQKFEEAEPFSEGFGVVGVADDPEFPGIVTHRYYINGKGANAFGNQRFDDAKPFKEGLAMIYRNEKWYYINRNRLNAFGGKSFDSVEPFNNGIAHVREGIRPYTIDKTGEDVRKKQSAEVAVTPLALPNDFKKTTAKTGGVAQKPQRKSHLIAIYTTKTNEQYTTEAEQYYTIPELVKEKFPDLIKLIFETESMPTDEREYWLQALPKMDENELIKLRDILINEKEHRY